MTCQRVSDRAGSRKISRHAEFETKLFSAILLTSIPWGTLSVREALETYEGFLDLADGFVEDSDESWRTNTTGNGDLFQRLKKQLSTTSLSGAFAQFSSSVQAFGSSIWANDFHPISTRVVADWRARTGRVPRGVFNSSLAFTGVNGVLHSSAVSLGHALKAGARSRPPSVPMSSSCTRSAQGQSLGCRHSEQCRCGMLEQCFSTSEESMKKRSAEDHHDDPGVCGYSVVVLVSLSIGVLGCCFMLFIGLRVYAQWRERIASLYTARRSAGILLGDVCEVDAAGRRLSQNQPPAFLAHGQSAQNTSITGVALRQVSPRSMLRKIDEGENTAASNTTEESSLPLGAEASNRGSYQAQTN